MKLHQSRNLLQEFNINNESFKSTSYVREVSNFASPIAREQIALDCVKLSPTTYVQHQYNAFNNSINSCNQYQLGNTNNEETIRHRNVVRLAQLSDLRQLLAITKLPNDCGTDEPCDTRDMCRYDSSAVAERIRQKSSRRGAVAG